MSVAVRLFCAPVAGLVPVDIDEANQLLAAWGHDLGPCDRPFGVEAWVLDVRGRSVSVAVSATTVSDHVLDGAGVAHPRLGLVELARLASDPDERWATRPMLRLWREVAAPAWSHWPGHLDGVPRPIFTALVSYSTRRHEGDLYRFDGWECWGERAGSTGGGTWSKRRGGGHPAEGVKKLWGWRLR